MKKNLILLFSILFTTFSCSDSEDQHQHYRMPAEFESQKAIWFASPTVDYKEGWSMLNTQADMIKELIASVDINYSINSEADKTNLINTLINKGVSQNIINEKIEFYNIEHGDLWVRDTGGTYLKDKDGNYLVVDLEFDAYRMGDYLTPESYAIYQLDNDAGVKMAESIGIEVKKSSLIAEGGNFHFNGKGTVVAIERSLTMSNPNLSKTQIKELVKETFHVNKVILLPEGLPTDAHPVIDAPYTVENEILFNLGVIHIDEMFAWVNENTCLIPKVSEEQLATGNPIVLKANQVLEDAVEILKNEKTESGLPINIIRTPEPAYIPVTLTSNDFMYQFLGGLIGIRNFPTNNDEPIQFILAASYMNYVVANDVVLIPKLYKPGRDASLESTDEEFKNIMEAVFPDRRIVQVDVDALTVGGGGMHCITQQIPN